MKRLRVTGLGDAEFVGRGWRFRFGGRHIAGLLCGRVGNRRVSIGECGPTVRLLYNVYLLPTSSKVATRMY